MNSILFDPAALLYTHTQDGRPIEEYVEEFIGLTHLVPWSDGTLKTLFWLGLDDHLLNPVSVTDTTCSLTQYIDHVLWLVGAVDETTITTQPLVTLSKSAPAFSPEHALEIMIPKTSAKKMRQKSKHSESAPACPPGLLGLALATELTAPTLPPVFASVPESSNSVPVPEFNPPRKAESASTFHCLSLTSEG